MMNNAREKNYDDRELKRRYEKINGETVMLARPATNHGEIAGNIYRIFAGFLHKRKRCKPLMEPEVHLDEKNHFVPDFAIVCDRSKLKRFCVEGAPDFVVEILSPRTAKYDRTEKKTAYERAGVREYWLINPADKTIEVYYLTDGTLLLDNVYHLYDEEELAALDEKEREEIKIRVKVSLYDDFEVEVADVFDDLTTWAGA